MPGEEQEIDLLFRQRDRISHKGDRPPWLQLKHLGDRFETALQGWFAFRKSDKEAYDLLNEYVRFGDDRLHQDQLLDLARIIELYHRGADRYEQLVVTRDEHRARIKKLAAAVPDEDKSWLKDKLARATSTLPQKIVELVEDLGVAVEPVIKCTVEEFAAQATNNRNYYTHYSSYYKDAGKIAEDLELYTLVQQLLVVVRACVLRELGFKNGDRRSCFRAHVGIAVPP